MLLRLTPGRSPLTWHLWEARPAHAGPPPQGPADHRAHTSTRHGAVLSLPIPHPVVRLAGTGQRTPSCIVARSVTPTMTTPLPLVLRANQQRGTPGQVNFPPCSAAWHAGARRVHREALAMHAWKRGK